MRSASEVNETGEETTDNVSWLRKAESVQQPHGKSTKNEHNPQADPRKYALTVIYLSIYLSILLLRATCSTSSRRLLRCLIVLFEALNKRVIELVRDGNDMVIPPAVFQ